MMTSDELIESGVCEDLDEVLQMFPIELLDDFAPDGSGSAGLGAAAEACAFFEGP